MSDLASLSVRETVAAVREGRLTAEGVTRAHLDRVAEREEAVCAFVHLDPERALAEARAVDARVEKGPLAGAVLGVKDVIDTADMPTGYGSAAYEGFRPAWDASCVALARLAGAVALGKTVSTEFAMATPGATRNPHDPSRTPGGSSSGSAAAVAAGMVQIAFGTQTSGSVIRPACFCGVVGFKPSFGLLSRTGLKPLADSLDTLGLMARNVGDVALLAAVLARRPDLDGSDSGEALQFARFDTSRSALIGAGTREALARAIAALGGETAVSVRPVPAWWDGLHEAQDAVMGWEVVDALAFERTAMADRIHPRTATFLAERGHFDRTDYENGLAARDHALAALSELFGEADILVTPAAPNEAPVGLGSTGDPTFNKAWTLLRLPAITVPAGYGPNGLPVGVQLVGLPGRDATVLAAARRLEAALGE